MVNQTRPLCRSIIPVATHGHSTSILLFRECFSRLSCNVELCVSGLLASRGDVEDIGCHGDILGYTYLYVLLFC